MGQAQYRGCLVSRRTIPALAGMGAPARIQFAGKAISGSSSMAADPSDGGANFGRSGTAAQVATHRDCRCLFRAGPSTAALVLTDHGRCPATGAGHVWGVGLLEVSYGKFLPRPSHRQDPHGGWDVT